MTFLKRFIDRLYFSMTTILFNQKVVDSTIKTGFSNKKPTKKISHNFLNYNTISGFTAFDSLPKAMKISFIDLLMKCWGSPRKHTTHAECFVLTKGYLRKVLKGQFDKLNKLAGSPFVQVVKSSYTSHSALGWQLSPEISSQLERFFDPSRAKLEQLVDAKIVITPIGKAIRSITDTGGNTKHKFMMNSNIQVNHDKLYTLGKCANAFLADDFDSCPDDMLSLYQDWSKNRIENTERVKLIKKQAAMLCYLASLAETNDNRVTLLYQEISSGRLYGYGVANLQACVREVRKAALFNQVDIDIENCHYSLLSQMASRIGLETPAMDYYIANKAEVRASVAKALCVPQNDVKRCFISLIYGASSSYDAYDANSKKSKREITEMGQILGDKATHTAFIEHNLVKGLIDDIKAASKAVVDSRIASTTKCGRLVNDFQKEWIVPAKMTSQAYRESMAHVLQGAEALILNTMCTTLNGLGVEISCLQHDGITCQQITPAQLQIVTNEVLKNTGYVIRLESENLNSF